MPTPLKISPQLATQAGACVTKLDWATTINTGLGNTRRVRCFHDPAGGPDPFTSGVEFLNVGSSGPLTMVGGNITYLGKLSGVTKQIAADLTTGTSVLRIEGNGEWVEGGVGLPAADTLFHLTANIAAGKGFSFKKGTGIKAPVLLDSGTGPLSPAPTAGTVTQYRLCDYSTGSRVVVGTKSFSVREPNLVMQQPWMATEMGDVRIMRTPDDGGLVIGTGGDSFVFGGDILLANPVVNGEANVPLQDVEIRCKPYGRWDTYPFMGSLDIAEDTLIPPPHKIELLNATGAIVDVIEMYSTRDANNTPGSGWPVNDPRMSVDYWNTYKPVQPWWNCFMVHNWSSHMPKMHSLATHFLPTVEAEALHPSNLFSYDADNDQWPLVTGNYNMNSLNSYKVAPKWAQPRDVGHFDVTPIDPYFATSHDMFWICQLTGYGYEPGAPGKMKWFMAPGGPSHDRAPWPHIAVAYITDPNGVRTHGNVPLRTLWHHWTKAYFNQAQHYFTDVNKGTGIPKARILAGETCYQDTYYGDNQFRPDMGHSAIRMFAVANAQHDGQFKDKHGREFLNQWSRDILHNQHTSALGAYLTVSPRHVLNARHSFTAAITAAFDLSRGITKYEFMVRGHAWYNWQLANMWMIGNEHPEGFTIDEIEDMWGRHLEQSYDLAVPEYLAQATPWAVGLKRFGIQTGFTPIMDSNGNPTGTYRFGPPDAVDQDSKMYYFGQLFLLMKQSGSWDKMCARSPKCKAVLELILNCLSTYAIGVYVDANGIPDAVPDDGSKFPNGDYKPWGYLPPTTTGNTLADIPATWAAFCNPKGPKDLLHQEDGKLSSYLDGYLTTHLRAQWCWMMRDYFSEYTFPRLDQAIAKIDAWYAFVKNGRIAGTSQQWHYRFAYMGKFNVAAKIGAPTTN